MNFIHGSFRLAASTAGKGKTVSGMRGVMPNRSGLAGATSRAPAIRSGWRLAETTDARQPKLCATSHTGLACAPMAASTRADHESMSGRLQSS